MRRHLSMTRARKESNMPRYLVERDFADGVHLLIAPEGAAVREIIARNSDCDVTWVHTFVSDDKRKTYCIYDSPNPEAIRRAAKSNDLPIGKITNVSALDPYFYF
jgi:hypothetical protein